MRTFVAIPCPGELKDRIIEFQDRIKNTGKIKLVERENIHLTLKFLGDVDENKIKDIIKILDSISKNEKNKKFKINLCGVGVFPNENYIKIRLKQHDIDLSRLRLEVPAGAEVFRTSTTIPKEKIEKVVLEFLFGKIPWKKQIAGTKEGRSPH